MTPDIIVSWCGAVLAVVFTVTVTGAAGAAGYMLYKDFKESS